MAEQLAEALKGQRDGERPILKIAAYYSPAVLTHGGSGRGESMQCSAVLHYGRTRR